MVWDFIFILALPIIFLSVDSDVTLEITLLLSDTSLWTFLLYKLRICCRSFYGSTILSGRVSSDLGDALYSQKNVEPEGFFVQRRNLKAVIYLIVLAFFFYFHVAYEYLQGKPYIYQKIYKFWLSVIPEFYCFDREKAFIEHIGIQKGWINENE